MSQHFTNADAMKAEALFNFALLLQNGSCGVIRNAVHAEALYRTAIETAGHVGAMVKLAEILERGASGIEPDVAEAEELYLAAILKTEPAKFVVGIPQYCTSAPRYTALRNLANLYLHGHQPTVKRNVSVAVKLLKKVVYECQCQKTMRDLAAILSTGDNNVSRNIPVAIELLETVLMKSEDFNAMLMLANVLNSSDAKKEGLQDVARAASLYKTVIKNSEQVDALIGLAGILECDAYDIEQDIPRAISLYEKAIEKYGDVRGLTKLGKIFKNEKACEQNEKKTAFKGNEKGILNEEYDTALTHLVTVLQCRTDGVSQAYERALKLHTQVLKQDSCKSDMQKFAIFLLNDTESLERNVPYAAELLEILYEKFVDAMDVYRLASHLYRDSEDIDVNIARTALLFKNIIGCLRGQTYQSVFPDARSSPWLRSEAIGTIFIGCHQLLDGDGHALATFIIADMMMDGWNRVRSSPAQAASLFERLIDDYGHIDSMYKLAGLLFEHKNISPKFKEGTDLLNRAFEEGGLIPAVIHSSILDVYAIWGSQRSVLTKSVEYNPQRIISKRQMLIREQALDYHMGSRGVRRDHRRAVEIYEQLICKYKDSFAMQKLALILNAGAVGIDRNVPRAVALAKNSTEYGDKTNPDSLTLIFNLNIEHDRTDLLFAANLCEHTLKTTASANALYVFAGSLRLNPVIIFIGLAMKCYEKAIKDHNDVRAMHALGKILSTGECGVQRDIPKAEFLFQKAIDENGHIESMIDLALILERGSPGLSRNIGRAISLYVQAFDRSGDSEVIVRVTLLILKNQRKRK